MQQLTDLYRHILMHGQRKPNRTGIDTISIFGHQMRFNLRDGFPLATKKFVPFKLVASELLWFLKGQQDKLGALRDLHDDNNHIWDEWAKPDDSFGPIYGVQWRRWLKPILFHHRDGEMGSREFERRQLSGETCDVAIRGFDQIAWLINELKSNPESRRLIVTAWQPAEINDMALPPCHVLFQLNCRPYAGTDMTKRWTVDLQLYQRSCDVFLGVPFNIASYALLLHMLVQCAGPEYTVGDFVWTGGDVHLYENHLDAVRQYDRSLAHPLPNLLLTPGITDIDSFTLEDLKVSGYQHSGKIAAEVAV